MARQIRDYVRRAREEPTTEHIQALWRAVFLLKGWYFLPAAGGEGPEHPSVMLVEGQPWLVAFTNVRRLEAFARAQGREASDGGVPLLVLDPLVSMENIREAAEAVVGVVFNPGSPEGFRAPVEALVEYARFMGVPLDEP